MTERRHITSTSTALSSLSMPLTKASTYFIGACLLASLLLGNKALSATQRVTSTSASNSADLRLKATIGTVPLHTIALQTASHGDANIVLDGVVDEHIWQTVNAHDNMLKSIPGTGEPASLPTDVRMLATEQGLYVSAVMYQDPETLVLRMSERDNFIDRDNFSITIDSTGNGSFAYWFIVALGGTKMDGKVLPERRYTNVWDGTWSSHTATFDKGWSVEMFLPWSMMSLPPGSGTRDIGFAVSRTVSYLNERYQWPGLSQSSPQFVSTLNTLQVDGIEPRKQYSVIPYATGTIDRARDDNEVRAGLDFTWRPSPLFEVVGALNPDFGAVEADDVVLNLTALEVFFPERRLFFLEGNEVFETANRASGGNNMRIYNAENFATTSRRVFATDGLPAPISLVNTRRIGGISRQTQVPSGLTLERGEANQPTDLLAAVKLTGNSGAFRYGLLSAFEDDVEWFARDTQNRRTEINAPGRDFAVARFVYETNPNNRYSLGYIGTHAGGPVFDASVHGIDAHFASHDGRWAADLQLLHSDIDDVTGEGGLLDLSYRPDSNNRHTVRLDYFDEQVDINDLGFLLRNDYASAQYVYTYIRPKPGEFIKNLRGALTLSQQYNISKGQVVDSSIFWRSTAVLSKRVTLRTGVAYFPKRFEDRDSRGNGAYQVQNRWKVDTLLSTDASRPMSFSFGLGGWQEDLGDWTYVAKAGVTLRPTSRLYADLDVSYLRRDGWLVYQGANNFGAYQATDWQPRLSLTWFAAAKHQLKLTLQWAGVRAEENGFFAVPANDGDLIPAARTRANHDFSVSLLTTQLRYRWEIAPLTDLFIVYNRGNVINEQQQQPFSDLFSEGFQEPLVDSFIVKLRYRFGN